MNDQSILDELLEVLIQRGITVRTEAMGGGGGGLCTFKENKIFFLDSQSASYESAVQAARAVLKVIEDTETIFMKPAVRDFLDRIKEID